MKIYCCLIFILLGFAANSNAKIYRSSYLMIEFDRNSTKLSKVSKERIQKYLNYLRENDLYQNKYFELYYFPRDGSLYKPKRHLKRTIAIMNYVRKIDKELFCHFRITYEPTVICSDCFDIETPDYFTMEVHAKD